MSEQRNVTVSLAERSYTIQIGNGNLASLADSLRSMQTTHALIVYDAAVQSWLEPLVKGLKASGIRHDLFPVASGESSKSTDQLDRLWQAFQAAGADRMSVVLAVGGGVVGDLAGFAAATYARGLRFVQVPTTLLAMVDSSVGGKTGINLPTSKNMVGAFWQPSHVAIDMATLDSLPRREYVSGLAEVIKYGVILDADFLKYLESQVEAILQRDPHVLAPMIARCCELKAQVVQEDERETSGRRAILNYGHTFGHAFESELGYGTLLHGEAVAIGMDCAARLAEKLGRVDETFVERQRRLIESLELPWKLPQIDRDLVMRAMMRDKKVAHGKLRFILPDRIGQVSLVGDVDWDCVAAVLQSPSSRANST